MLFFQHEDGEQVTVRDIRLQMEQDENHRATVDFSGRVKPRPAGFGALAIRAGAGRRLSSLFEGGFSQFNWQLRGRNSPPEG